MEPGPGVAAEIPEQKIERLERELRELRTRYGR